MPLTTGDALVKYFQSLEWVNYTWGGSDITYGWDCSGAVNYVCGWHFKLAIPGYGPGQFDPRGGNHGPVVADWLSSTLVIRHQYPSFKPAAGDLVAWFPNVHMGMAINESRFVSAANPSQGTIEADISGFFNYDPAVLRIIQVITGASLPGVSPPPGPGADDYSETIRRTANGHVATGRSVLRTGEAMHSLRNWRHIG